LTTPLSQHKLASAEAFLLGDPWAFVFEILDGERVAAFEHLDAPPALVRHLRRTQTGTLDRAVGTRPLIE
jgi:hypothetical protein